MVIAKWIQESHDEIDNVNQDRYTPLFNINPLLTVRSKQLPSKSAIYILLGVNFHRSLRNHTRNFKSGLPHPVIRNFKS